MPGNKEKLPLSVTHPEVAKEADGWDPTAISQGSGRKLNWKCPKGHNYFATVTSRTFMKSNCPYCSGLRVIAGENDLATTHPEFAKMADGWDPTAISAGSNKKMNWLCPKGHRTSVKVVNQIKSLGCAICSGRKVLSGFNDLATTHPELATESDGWDATSLSAGSNKKVSWQCKFGHKWSATVANRSAGRGCPVCQNKLVVLGINDFKTLNPDLAAELVDGQTENITQHSGVRLKWKCRLGHIWTASVNSRSGGNGCPYCSGHKLLEGFNDLATTHPDYARMAFGWNPNTVSAGSSVKRQWRCDENHIWSSVVGNVTLGKGCAVCNGNQINIGINDLKTTHPQLAYQAVDWNPEEFTQGSNKRKKWKCSEGHQWMATINDRTNGKGCPTCAVTGFDPNIPAILYLIEHEVHGLIKIGITNTKNKKRLDTHRRNGWKTIELRGPMEGFLAQEWESSILRMLKAKGADLSNVKIAGKFDGYSEAWSKSKFEVSSIKELMKLTEEYEGN